MYVALNKYIIYVKKNFYLYLQYYTSDSPSKLRHITKQIVFIIFLHLQEQDFFIPISCVFY